jgi:hypothetical protein
MEEALGRRRTPACMLSRKFHLLRTQQRQRRPSPPSAAAPPWPPSQCRFGIMGRLPCVRESPIQLPLAHSTQRSWAASQSRRAPRRLQYHEHGDAHYIRLQRARPPEWSQEAPSAFSSKNTYSACTPVSGPRVQIHASIAEARCCTLYLVLSRTINRAAYQTSRRRSRALYDPSEPPHARDCPLRPD